MNFEEFESIVDRVDEVIEGEDVLTAMAALHCVMDIEYLFEGSSELARLREAGL